ncbi:hypothetical protein [Pendulispora albinea]|uniref:Zinc-finger domain-containing protein n=1 Tax=Pendulispora albinea TaxID=2741071 RepID=A0ABZ2MAC2_9BACT
MPLNDQHVRSLLQASKETHAHEIDCDEFNARMAEYAEARAAHRPIPETLAKVVEHERLCANCAEECRALIEILQA